MSAVLDIRAQLRAELEAQKGRVAPPTGNRISTKGKMFTFPDGKTSAGPIDLIILDWRITHQLLPPYNPSKFSPPSCWAISKTVDGAAPSDKVFDPKCDACVNCANNQFGSSPVGKGKACKEQRRLAVVPADATESTQVLILDVSPTGIKSFDGYVDRLRSTREMIPLQVITSVAFDPSQAYPTLLFGNPQPVDDDAQLAVLMNLRKAAESALDREPDGTAE